MTWDDIYEIEDQLNLDLLKKGAELVAFNEMPIGAYVEKYLQKYLSFSSDLAAKKRAVWYLTLRPSAAVPTPKPFEKSLLTFRFPSGKKVSLKARWLPMGKPHNFFTEQQAAYDEVFQDRSLFDSYEKLISQKVFSGLSYRTEGLSSSSFNAPKVHRAYRALNNPIQDEVTTSQNGRAYLCTGYGRFGIPEQAQILEGATLAKRMLKNKQSGEKLARDSLSRNSFLAYYYPVEVLINGKKEVKNIGYLRIPHYVFLNPVSQFYMQERNKNLSMKEKMLQTFNRYKKIVSELESKTDALVIDQSNNCGGLAALSEKVASLFIDRSFRSFPVQYVANWQSYNGLKSTLDEAGSTFSFNKSTNDMYRLLENIYREVKSSLSEGRYLTKPIYGANVKPDPSQYTKPIVFLIDSFSVSAGDAVPDMLKTHSPKTLLIGESTQGGGGGRLGTEGGEKLLPHSGVDYSLAMFMFTKINGQPLENRGVQPHYEYKLTEADFLNGYKDYQKLYESIITLQLSSQSDYYLKLKNKQ